MQMLYNSDHYVVVAFDVGRDEPIAEVGEATEVAAEGAATMLRRGGYEIVDKFARREIFIEGAVAESFRNGVQALVGDGPADPEKVDEYIAGYTVLAQQPVVLH